MGNTVGGPFAFPHSPAGQPAPTITTGEHTMTSKGHRIINAIPCLGAYHPKRQTTGGIRRANIMARREQTHVDHAGQTTRNLMRRFKGYMRPEYEVGQRSNTESKRLGLPHQGAREMARRVRQMEAANGRP